ncbi:aminotransferase class V-fold PLP-dependent enzyme [Halobaculum sp. MBLA0147]|uniref:aminotransferase class V-fold PLP-dependent enzyme n=1 Tax=Halobaculum sp. MBLA0147 TaxID=3079934 RepID=UPI0035266FC3
MSGLTPMELRADVPALSEEAYFNYGAHGPSPRYVVERAESFLADHEFTVPAASDPYQHAFDTYDEVRERVARFINAAPAEIALTESTTAGINAVADGISWEDGDVVVRTDLEHPAGTLPWRRLERAGVEVRTVPTEGGRINRDAFADAVADAKLACFSAITWTHGTQLPVTELVKITHDAGALALVDAVQVPGQAESDVDVWDADAVAAAGHKWLLGLWGGGFLYVDHAVADELAPRRVGYRSVNDASGSSVSFAPGAERFEVGSANPAPHVALSEAMDTIREVGITTIRDRITALTERFTDAVPDKQLLTPTPAESGLVTIDVPDPQATVERLGGAGITIRSLSDPDAVRASIHAVNTATEVDRLARELDKSTPTDR